MAGGDKQKLAQDMRKYVKQMQEIAKNDWSNVLGTIFARKVNERLKLTLSAIEYVVYAIYQHEQDGESGPLEHLASVVPTCLEIYSHLNQDLICKGSPDDVGRINLFVNMYK
jgi:hypothetical protein